MADQALPLLWHLKISNFNEKVRWTLDYKRVPHRRRQPIPGAHMGLALFLTRGRTPTLPIIQLDGETIGDSTRIIAALEERYPEPPLYPADPSERRRALELEEWFDENLGPHVRRVAFSHLLSNPDYMEGIGASGPVFRVLVRGRYSVTGSKASDSLAKVREALREIERRLDGRDHLVGESFSVADLTAAALVGPALRPPQLPYGVSREPLPPSLEELSSEFRATPAGQWMLRTYERYRKPGDKVRAAPVAVGAA
jgi:glutathione S-transferase